jgi:hypothetical protein
MVSFSDGLLVGNRNPRIGVPSVRDREYHPAGVVASKRREAGGV